MKRFVLIMLCIMLCIVLLINGCTRTETEAQEPPVSAPAEEPASAPAAAGESAPAPIEPIAVQKPLPSVEEPDKGIFVIDPLEAQEYLDIQKMKLQRISRDRGELKELTIVFRNIEREPLTPMLRLVFDKADVKGREGMVEQDFPLPTIQPGMKLVREFPVSILFSNIEKNKTITLKFYKKFESPRSYYGTYKRTFKPIDEFGDLEIRWL